MVKKGNGNQQPQGPQQPPNPGPVVHSLTVNLHQNGMVSFSHPKDFKIFSSLLANLMGAMPQLKFEEPSSIITLPPGARLKEPPK